MSCSNIRASPSESHKSPRGFVFKHLLGKYSYCVLCYKPQNGCSLVGFRELPHLPTKLGMLCFRSAINKTKTVPACLWGPLDKMPHIEMHADNLCTHFRMDDGSCTRCDECCPPPEHERWMYCGDGTVYYEAGRGGAVKGPNHTNTYLVSCLGTEYRKRALTNWKCHRKSATRNWLITQHVIRYAY